MKKLRILLFGNIQNPELDNELQYSEELSPYVESVEKTSILPTAWNFINQGKINTIFVNPREKKSEKPINEEIMKFISDVRKEHSGKIAFVLYTNTEKARQELETQYPNFEFEQFIKVNFDNEDLNYFDRLKLALKKCIYYLSEQPLPQSEPEPTPQPEPISQSEQLPSSNFPKWGFILGASLLGVGIIFIMALLIANLYNKDISGNGRLLVAALLALITSTGSGFLGGSAAASGEIRTPEFFKNHITFGLTGGVAVFIVVFLITIAAYGYLPGVSIGSDSNSNTNNHVPKSPSPAVSSTLTNSTLPSPSSSANRNSNSNTPQPTVTGTSFPTNTPPFNPPVPAPRNGTSSTCDSFIPPEIISAIARQTAGGKKYRITVKIQPVYLPRECKLYLDAAKDATFSNRAKNEPFHVDNTEVQEVTITIDREENTVYYVRFMLEIPNKPPKFSSPAIVNES